MVVLNKSNQLIMQAIKSNDLWRRVEHWSIPEPNSGCLLWLGALSRKGYAVINCGQVPIKVSRLVLTKLLGKIPHRALHTCDIHCCIAENHLYEGTDVDNARDMFNRGRLSRNPNGTLASPKR